MVVAAMMPAAPSTIIDARILSSNV
jgi:hypothetical protein